MCGISGIVGDLSNTELASAALRMHVAIAHRGPDAEGVFESDDVILMHRRLSIIDLSENANQPMTDPSGRYTIVFNGEVYNFREIRSRFSEYDFTTDNDAEVVLAAYVKHGADCLELFNGMFAFAIWDKERSELFFARDRLGIKPFYYHRNDGQFVFASEVRAILKSGLVEKELDGAALDQLLAYQTVFAPRTIVRGVKSLPAGHYGRFSNGNLELKSWWSAASVSQISADDADRRVRELLATAIQRRLVSDVPVGAFLSGGIDSSAIVALMAQQSEQAIDTFSVVFGEEDYDESRWSEMIAKKYKTNHHPIHVDPKDLPQQLPEALAAMDHPSGDGINSYVISKVTRDQGIKVALSGLGSDELFGGYPVFSMLPDIVNKSWYWALPKGAKRIAANLKSGRAKEKLDLLATLEKPSYEAIYPVFRGILSPKMRADLLKAEAEQFPGIAEAIAGTRFNQENMSAISAMEIATYTNHVLLRDTDQMSMAHALEVRVPFFDHELVEFMLSLPDEVKKGEGPKPLLVKALGADLPSEIVNRKKMGFVFPWEHWLRNELKEFAQSRLQNLSRRSQFNPDAITKLWNRFLKKDPAILWVHIWILVVLEDWLQRNFES